MVRLVAALLVVSLVVGAVACGDDDEAPSPSQTATRSPGESGTPTRSAIPSPTDEPFEGGREPVEATPSPGAPVTALLRDVRVAEQGGFDRITLEFEADYPAIGLNL